MIVHHQLTATPVATGISHSPILQSYDNTEKQIKTIVGLQMEIVKFPLRIPTLFHAQNVEYGNGIAE